MKIDYSDPHELPREKAGDAIFHADPIALLKVSQFLSLHAPEVGDYLSFPHRGEHRASSSRCDCGERGSRRLIVDDDLIAALKSGHIAAVGLDVYDGEPKLHPGDIALENTFCSRTLAPQSSKAGPIWGWSRSTILMPF